MRYNNSKKALLASIISPRYVNYLIRAIKPGERERSPDYQKLRARDTHIWGIRRSQPNRSAMEGPRPGGTAFMITVAPTPGKYAFTITVFTTTLLTISFYLLNFSTSS